MCGHNSADSENEGCVCDDSQNNMMRMHKLGGGEMNVEEAACNWVQENRNKYDVSEPFRGNIGRLL